LLVLIPEALALQDVFEMAAVVRGGRAQFEAKPFVSPYLNPVSPLLYNPETIDKLFMAVDWHTPVVCQAAPQLGGSSPVTVAGSITQAAAETLTGLVLSQLRRPGAAFITGVVPFEMEMRTGNVIAAGPDMSLFHMGFGQLTKWWGLPALGVGGGGDAKIVDEQAVMELAYYMGTMFWSGMDMTFDVGCLDCGLAFSPELLALGDEMISIYRAMFKGFDVSDEAIAVDVVKEIGPGGFFLGQKHTLDLFRDLWSPSLLAWEPRNMWEERGGTTLRQRAAAKVAELLETHEVPPLPDDVLAGMRAIIDAREALIEPDED
jgi:trimethylamine--corrinoid protein Co-methyltransferase